MVQWCGLFPSFRSIALIMDVQLVVSSGSRSGQVIPIAEERFVIGRAEDCHLKPRSELVSRYHCEIFLKDGGVFVRDMGSKNGVFLNGHQITETFELKHGDKLTVGPLEFFAHIVLSEKPQKPPRVKSVSDAVARTVAIQSENTEKSQEDSIADWLLAAGESDAKSDTELMAHLQSQSEKASRERDGWEDSTTQSETGVRSGSPATSRDVASELMRKFFHGGK